MPRARNKENQGLPARWQHRHGAYYYQVPLGAETMWGGKKLYKLGSSLSEAFRKWADVVGATDKANTISQLLDRYALEVIPTKAPKTQTNDIRYVNILRRAMGPWNVNSVRPKTIYEYMDKRSAKVAGRREIALLSHAFTKAVQWGAIDKHPFKGEVRLEGEKPRTRYIEDWELEECLNLAPRRGGADATKFLQCYLRVKLLTGLRQGDMLGLRVSDLTDEGIRVETSKTGKRIIISWTPALKTAIDAAKAAREVDISPWLFCNRRGECYVHAVTGTASGFNSIWQRFMARVLEETKVTERFTEHDIRAKTGSDAASDQAAQSLLTHANVSMTKRTYRRRAEVVSPLY